MKRDEQEAEKRRSQRTAWRVWMKAGEEGEVVVLDHSLEDTFWRKEHNLMGADGKYGNYEPCLSDFGVTCPHCKTGNPYTAIYLTVLDTRGFTTKKGERVEFSKKLLVLKRGQHEAWSRLERIAMKRGGTFRGACIILARGHSDDEPGTGTPTANEDGQILNDYLTESQLQEYYGNDEELGRDGKVLKEMDADITPFNYEEMFPAPTEEELEERRATVPGSVASNRRARGAAAAPAQAQTRDRRGRGTAAPAPAPEPPARGGRPQRQQAPARQQALDNEGEGYEGEEEEAAQPLAQVARTGRPRTPVAQAPAQAEQPAPAPRRPRTTAPEQPAPAPASATRSRRGVTPVPRPGEESDDIPY